ncbi:MAG: beta-lactamase family protein, partial [Verrucomicrobiae bacterium]|nr:beta-lactamase family protein [Verrucomicrobiae bacterium]
MVDRLLSWLGHPGQDFADGAFSERPAASSPRNRRPRTAFVSRLPADFDGLSRLFRSAFHDLDLMKRRAFFLNATGGLIVGTPLFAAVKRDGLEAAAEILKAATASGQIDAASLHVSQGDTVFGRVFGTAPSSVEDSVFLLASISKTISTAAVMTLFDQGKFALDDPVATFIPEFTGEGREKITIRQLLTHVSGLPDQLPENAKLRAGHAPLSAFVEAAIRTPLLFA